MNKILSFILLLLVTSSAIGQSIGRVDKKTKEFYVPSELKIEYTVFGYEFPNITTRKMICFSSSVNSVRGSTCPLGAYFDTDKMKPGDKVLYMGPAGPFAKMSFNSLSNSKKTIFYLPRSSFVIK